MPIYSFVDEEGNPHEKFYRMADAPRIGQLVTIDGISCRRVVDFHLSSGLDTNRKVPKYPYSSHALPRQNMWTRQEIAKTGTKFDRTGKPIIRTPAHEKSVGTAFNCEKQ